LNKTERKNQMNETKQACFKRINVLLDVTEDYLDS